MIDPKQFNLDSRTVIEKDDDCFYIVINRKSRLVMADGRKIIEKVAKIKALVTEARVKLKTCAPVCSKTRSYLEAQGVGLLEVHSVEATKGT